MIQMPTWKYDIIELMNMYVFITLKKTRFLRKKIPPKGQFLFKNNQKKEVKKK